MLFWLVPGGFSDRMNLKIQIQIGKKYWDLETMQETLENKFFAAWGHTFQIDNFYVQQPILNRCKNRNFSNYWVRINW